MFIIDAKRVNTMRMRLGKDASEIIKDDRFLPMFRNRQKQYPREFAASVKLARKKRNPYRYLSTLWKKSNILKTLDLIGKTLSKTLSKVARGFDQLDVDAKQVNRIRRQQILNQYNIHKCFRI